MPKKYEYIQMFVKEILDLKETGFIRKEFGDKLGFAEEPIHGFTKRYDNKRRQFAVVNYL